MKGNVVVAGDVELAPDPHVLAGEEQSEIFKRSLLIQFPDAGSLREAIESGICEFTYFDRLQAAIDE